MTWKTFLHQQLTALNENWTLQASLNLDPLLNYLPYILGLGIIGVSHSTLALLRGRKHLALLITPLSILIAYLAEIRLGANYFLVLFGSALALSALVGVYTRESN